MPYKSLEEKRLHDTDYRRKKRGTTVGTTNKGDDTVGTTGLTKGRNKSVTEKVKSVTLPPTVTKDGTYFKDGVEMVPPSDIEGLERMFQSLPERPRYLTLSDGQVLDRARPVKPSLTTRGHIERMRRCNEATQMVPLSQSKNKSALTERLKTDLHLS